VAANLHNKAPNMTAGVQSIEPAAYLPPSPSPSGADANAAGAVDGQAKDTQGAPQNFHSELQHQDTGTKEIKSADRPETGTAKSKKKRDAGAQVPNLSAVTPVKVAEPQKQILPLALTLPKPDEHATPSDAFPKAATLPKSTAAPLNQTPRGKAVLAAAPDSSQVQILPVATAVPVPEDAAMADQQPPASSRPGASPEIQPAPRVEVMLSATPPEPAAPAIQETVDSASSSSSPLAFAARMTAAPQKTVAAVPENPPPPPAAPDSPTLARIPVRYAATAQILPTAAPGTKPEAIAAVDRSVRTDIRTDIVPPRIESAPPVSPSSAPAAPQPAEPTARTERILEPPPAPPTSANDIRVRVPDNNGGSTQVRFLESGGEVRVSVRTADAELAQNLRGHLNDLTQRLADGGIPAEIWKPGSAASSSQNNQPQPDRDGRGSGGQQPGGQGGQQNHQEKRPAWLEQMEASLHGPQD